VIESEVTIINKLGLHARAAAKFVGCAGRFRSDVRVGQDEPLADGKSIMSVMMLAAARGTTLRLRVSGSDESAAMAALQTLIADRFEEDE
jgi:phosphocarrier protein HPr